MGGAGAGAGCCLYCPPVAVADPHAANYALNQATTSNTSVQWKARASNGIDDEDDDENAIKVSPALEHESEKSNMRIGGGGDSGAIQADSPGPGPSATSSSLPLPEKPSAASLANCIIRYKPIYEGDILVCRSTQFTSAIGKLFSTRVFKRWESCRIKFFEDNFTCQSNATAQPVAYKTKYSEIRYIQIFPRKQAQVTDPRRISKPCIRVSLVDHQILLQAKNSHICCQWFYTLHWRNRLSHGKYVLQNAENFQQIRTEMTSLVEYAMLCRISHDEVKISVLNVLSELLLANNKNLLLEAPTIQIVDIFQPLLLRVENYILSDQLCQYFSQFFTQYPESPYLLQVFAPFVHQLLKHNSDFGKRPLVRDFIADFFLALMTRETHEYEVQEFVAAAHGPTHSCPHIRVLSNLVAVCLASLQLCRSQHIPYRLPSSEINASSPPAHINKPAMSFTDPSRAESPDGGIFRDEDSGSEDSKGEIKSPEEEECIVRCFLLVLKAICQYPDWRRSLAPLLQPIPFSKTALVNESFVIGIQPVIDSFAQDERCEVHTSLLGVRDGKLGWFHLFAPGGLLAGDSEDGELFSHMLTALVNCCYKRKKFILYLATYFLSPILLLASKGSTEMMDVLCMMLHMEVLETSKIRLEVISTLESSKQGHERYTRTCQEISKMKELQSKGGPTMLSLPPKSSDSHLAQILQSGWFGNLESLSLAFTNVTNGSAELIMKLGGLKYLNLWSTQMGDLGLQMISDSLVNLQVLNLCETPVTDKGLVSLVHLKSLRRLNLNSTKLSPHTFDCLKKQLPLLQEVDVRYTEAW